MSRKLLVVFDLELTCWERGEYGDRVPEVIEIGAVKLDILSGQIVSTFSTLVKPRMNPVLSEYCTNLTGIKQTDLKGVGQFPEAYAQFMNWVGTHHKHVLVAWGRDWDDLTRDCKLHEIPIRHTHETMNANTLFNLKYPRVGLDKALNLLGQTFEGRRHRALDDAQATANVLLEVFNVNSPSTLL